MKKPVLVIMAAGMGSRYGGLKQIDPVDPYGNIIIDFSIFDAREAGFEKVIFIIKKAIEEDFKIHIGNRISKYMDVAYVYQELDKIPDGYQVPEGRVKPWGTGHAVLCCSGLIDGPFAVINADDYYGKEAYVKVHDYLVQEQPKDGKLHICMAGFRLGNTLSDNGSVTRGICHIKNGQLTGVTETHDIFKTATGAESRNADGSVQELDVKDLVSMNMWGLTPEFLEVLESGFRKFLSETKPEELKKEYLLPTVVDNMIKEGTAQVAVLKTHDTWFGVTYQEDKEKVMESFKELVRKGIYKEQLFS